MNKPVDFDNFTHNYNELLNEKTKFFSSSEEYFAHYKVNIIRQTISPSVTRVLEYGCGIGRNIPFLQAAFPNASILGSDIAPASLEMARNENPGVDFFQEGNITAEIGLFDLIFVAGVFHHIPPNLRADVFNTLFERLSPNGRIVIFEHNPFNPITRRIVSTCPYDEDAILLKPSEIKKGLKKAGLVVERHSYCLFIPPRFSNLVSIERFLSWLPLGGQYWIQALRPK